MPSHFYAPTKQDKFAFGIWCLQNRGRDPFGDQTRPELPALDCIRAWPSATATASSSTTTTSSRSTPRPPSATRSSATSRRRWPTGASRPRWPRPTSSITRSSRTAPSPAPTRPSALFATQKVMHCHRHRRRAGHAGVRLLGRPRRRRSRRQQGPDRGGASGSARRSTSCANTCSPTTTTSSSASSPSPTSRAATCTCRPSAACWRSSPRSIIRRWCGVNPETAHIKMAGLNPVSRIRPGPRRRQTARRAPQRPEAAALRPGPELRQRRSEGSVLHRPSC